MFVTMDLAKVSSVLSVAGVEISRTGLVIREGVKRETVMAELIPVLDYFQGSLLWWWGDTLNVFENRKWGEVYDEAEVRSGYENGTLRTAKSLCSKVQLSRRRDNLTYEHHATIAFAFDDEKVQDFWLDRAENEKLSTKALRRLISESKSTGQQLERSNPMMEQLNAVRLDSWSRRQNVDSWPLEQCTAWNEKLQNVRNLLAALDRRLATSGV